MAPRAKSLARLTPTGVPALRLGGNSLRTSSAFFAESLTSFGGIVEIQGTAEKKPFSQVLLFKAIENAKNALGIIFSLQSKMIENPQIQSITSETAI